MKEVFWRLKSVAKKRDRAERIRTKAGVVISLQKPALPLSREVFSDTVQ